MTGTDRLRRVRLWQWAILVACLVMLVAGAHWLANSRWMRLVYLRRLPEPPAVSEIRVTREQALEIVREALAKQPDLLLDKIWVVRRGTRTFFAPDGEPVYVVRMDARRKADPPGPIRYWPESFDWGVHATTGELLTEMVMLSKPTP